MKQIKIYGLGGQGVVTAAKILSEAVAIEEKKYAQAIPAYGHERRGAPVYADVIMDEKPIKLKSFVYQPDYVVIFDTSVTDKGVNVMAGTGEDTVFIVNAGKIDENAPYKSHQCYYVDARQISLEVVKKDIPNAAMLGAMAAAGLVEIAAVVKIIEKTFGKAGGVNAEAARRAYEQLQSNEKC